MFDTLRKSVGEEKFFAGLKKYYKENKGKIATPESLIGAFERTGVDANGFFDSFLSGKAIL
jgi:aminopeptidase N